MSKTSEHRNRYRNNVARWRAQYIPRSLEVDGHVNIDFASVIVTKRMCEKKGCKRKSDHRHHKGHEYLFATLDEETYARRYIEFRSEDIVYLCKKCHKSIHRLYQKIIDDLFFNINIFWVNGFDKNQLAGSEVPFDDLDKVMTKKEMIEYFRLLLVKKCEDWLNRSLPKKRKKRRK